MPSLFLFPPLDVSPSYSSTTAPSSALDEKQVAYSGIVEPLVLPPSSDSDNAPVTVVGYAMSPSGKPPLLFTTNVFCSKVNMHCLYLLQTVRSVYNYIIDDLTSTF